MKTLYLDTQTHIYITEECEPIEKAAFEKLIQSNEITLITSLYTLVEFAQSQSAEQAVRLADIFKKVPTLYSLNFHEIQANELYEFIFKYFYKCPIEPKSKFLPIDKIFDGVFEKPQDIILAARDDMQNFKRQFEDSANVLNKLTRHGKLSATEEDDVLFNIIIERMEFIEQSGRSFPGKNKRVIASDIVLKKKKQFFKENICAATEMHLSNHRSSNKNRKAKSSDAIDLVASVEIFPYVDLFVSNDGFLCSGLSYVQKQILLNTELYRKVSEIRL